MANQRKQGGKQANRDGDANSPTGTSGRQENSGNQSKSQDRSRPTSEGTRRKNAEEDDDSALGTRNTNR